MRHAVIGTGHWGSNHVRVAAELATEGLLDDVVIVDVDEQRASELASEHGTEYLTDPTVLHDLEIDTAVVATPSPTHHELATDLLEAGIDCLVEKPLALSSDEAWDIVRTADSCGRTLATGHIFRYHPALTALKDRVDAGDLGELRYLLTNRFSFRVPRETAGVLYSLAVHDVDIYNMLLGAEPDEVTARLDSHIREDIDETATLVVGYGETTGVINGSWQLPVYGKRRDLVVVGSEQVAYIDYLADNVLQLFDTSVVQADGDYRVRDDGESTIEVEDVEPLKAEVSDFLTASRTGSAPRATGRIGAAAIEVLERAQRSAR
jgi:predicted dehydrogenase